MATLIEKKAEEFCVKNGHRITEPRFAVLKIIASSKKPIKAYEILSQLSKILKNPKPPTAYRAIEFWQNLRELKKKSDKEIRAKWADGNPYINKKRFLI